jgi:hypothetical protein
MWTEELIFNCYTNNLTELFQYSLNHPLIDLKYIIEMLKLHSSSEAQIANALEALQV